MNRRSESTVRLSETTTPSRIRRALLPRFIVPERTMQPATLPILGTRKTSLISAVPSWASSNSGLSMPVSAASTSSMAW